MPLLLHEGGGKESVKDGSLLEEDDSEEIVGTRVDDTVAVFVLRGDRIVNAGQLFAETGFDLIEPGLLFRGNGEVVFPCTDELLSQVRVAAKRLLVSEFTTYNGVGFVVALVRRVAFQLADLGNIAVVIAEMLLALNYTGVTANNFVKLRIVKYFCHVM